MFNQWCLLAPLNFKEMAITVIRHLVPPVNEIHNVAFVTIESSLLEKKTTICRVFLCDEHLNALSQTNLVESDLSEEEFHRSMRKDCAKSNTLVTSLSSEPEWHPEGYRKSLEDFIKDESRA